MAQRRPEPASFQGPPRPAFGHEAEHDDPLGAARGVFVGLAMALIGFWLPVTYLVARLVR